MDNTESNGRVSSREGPITEHCTIADGWVKKKKFPSE